MEYYDTNLQSVAATRSPGWLRYPAGTRSDAFAWTNGILVQPRIDSMAAHSNACLATILQNDLPLMDCQMPELDGYETTRLIRERERAQTIHSAHTVKIIALTAHAMKEDRDKCLAVGMDDYLTKPIRMTDLEAALERCVAPHDGAFSFGGTDRAV